ncbi:MAG: tyrosine-type recombinase/integrase [Solirubrobacteraceae bacterium]
MTKVAPTLESWFTKRLITQRDASPRTIIAYRDTLRLLLRFAHETTGKQPSQLDFADLDATLIGAFLDHLETERGNSARTRNQRLAAIHSLYRYAALHHPEHAQVIARVIAIPTKRHDRKLISYLDLDEIKALLAAPDRETWHGRRDHALLLLAVQTGLRVSELTSLRNRDITLDAGAHCRVTGKGRKERCAILTTETVAVLRTWCDERQGRPDDPLFPTRQGGPLTPKAVAWLLDKHIATATRTCQSLAGKRVTPHVLRHTNAMLLRAEKIDLLTIALWLGHENTTSTEIYLHADNTIKQEAIDRIAPAGTPPAATSHPIACSRSWIASAIPNGWALSPGRPRRALRHRRSADPHRVGHRSGPDSAHTSRCSPRRARPSETISCPSSRALSATPRRTSPRSSAADSTANS